jgi:hypothetical protein
MVEQANSKSLKLAQKRQKEGQKALQTGWLKWSADYAEASFRFEEAAKIYRELDLKRDAAECFIAYAKACKSQND